MKCLDAHPNAMAVRCCDLWSIVIAAPMIGFCCLVFPSLRDIFARPDVTIPPVSSFAFEQCRMIEMHSSISVLVALGWCVLSVAALNANFCKWVSVILLIYFMALLFGVGMPLRYFILAG